MWNFASNCIAGTGNLGVKNGFSKTTQDALECSDDEASSTTSREEGLECPICWESFNIVENVPYILWCGHTLCKNCILGLQWAVVKVPPLPIQLPLFISCPWCSLLSLRLVYRGNLKFPRKNYFVLWMVERMNGDRVKARRAVSCEDHQSSWHSKLSLAPGSQLSHSSIRTVQSAETNCSHRHNSASVLQMLTSALRRSLIFIIQLTAKFPLVLILLLIVLYAIPASAIILALFILITVLFALPSFLILYFSYPTLDWLVREIIA